MLNRSVYDLRFLWPRWSKLSFVAVFFAWILRYGIFCEPSTIDQNLLYCPVINCRQIFCSFRALRTHLRHFFVYFRLWMWICCAASTETESWCQISFCPCNIHNRDRDGVRQRSQLRTLGVCLVSKLVQRIRYALLLTLCGLRDAGVVDLEIRSNMFAICTSCRSAVSLHQLIFFLTTRNMCFCYVS